MQIIEVNSALLSTAAIRQSCGVSRDLAYAITHRLPHVVVAHRGPHQSRAVWRYEFEFCLECITREKLVLRDVFCNWSLEQFEKWWAKCQSQRAK